MMKDETLFHNVQLKSRCWKEFQKTEAKPEQSRITTQGGKLAPTKNTNYFAPLLAGQSVTWLAKGRNPQNRSFQLCKGIKYFGMATCLHESLSFSATYEITIVVIKRKNFTPMKLQSWIGPNFCLHKFLLNCHKLKLNSKPSSVSLE